MDIHAADTPASSPQLVQSLTNVYVPLVWFDMSQSEAGSCERPYPNEWIGTL